MATTAGYLYVLERLKRNQEMRNRLLENIGSVMPIFAKSQFCKEQEKMWHDYLSGKKIK